MAESPAHTPPNSAPGFATPAAPHTMQCMEVWGGNRAADCGVIMPGLDAWVYSRPFEAKDDEDAGGDVHLVSSCGTGRITRMMLADVSGHGQGVARTAVQLRTLMRRFVNYLDQTAFVESVNRAFAESDAAGASGRFATSLAMTYFGPDAQLDICNAGHPRPLRWRAAKKEWEFLASADTAGSHGEGIANLPLGILEPTTYGQFGVPLERGDLVLAYTDAVTETRGANGELLGEAGLLRLVAAIDASRPEALLSSLVARLAEYRGSDVPDDDLTLLLLRPNGLRTQAPFLARAWAGAKFVGILARRLVPIGERVPIPWPDARRENLLGAIVPAVSRRRARRASSGSA